MNDSGRPRPIHSSLADDPTRQAGVEKFVLGLSAQIDDLQDAEVQTNLEEVAALAASLAEHSTEHGFEILSRCCEGVQRAARARALAETRKALIELTEVAHRVRLGYRGAL